MGFNINKLNEGLNEAFDSKMERIDFHLGATTGDSYQGALDFFKKFFKEYSEDINPHDEDDMDWVFYDKYMQDIPRWGDFHDDGAETTSDEAQPWESEDEFIELENLLYNTLWNDLKKWYDMKK